MGTLELLFELSISDPIVRNEEHVLRNCPLYDDTYNLLNEDITTIFKNAISVRDIVSFLRSMKEYIFSSSFGPRSLNLLSLCWHIV